MFIIIFYLFVQLLVCFLGVLSDYLSAYRKTYINPPVSLSGLPSPPYHKVYGILTTFICLSGIAK